MLSLGFEFAIPAIDRPQIYALERPATVIECISNLLVSEHTDVHLAEMCFLIHLPWYVFSLFSSVLTKQQNVTGTNIPVLITHSRLPV